MPDRRRSDARERSRELRADSARRWHRAGELKADLDARLLHHLGAERPDPGVTNRAGDRIEVWFIPTGGMTGDPVKIDDRPFNPHTDPPAFIDFDGVTLIPVRFEQLNRGSEIVWRVEVVDPEYSAET